MAASIPSTQCHRLGSTLRALGDHSRDRHAAARPAARPAAAAADDDDDPRVSSWPLGDPLVYSEELPGADTPGISPEEAAFFRENGFCVKVLKRIASRRRTRAAASATSPLRCLACAIQSVSQPHLLLPAATMAVCRLPLAAIIHSAGFSAENLSRQGVRSSGRTSPPGAEAPYLRHFLTMQNDHLSRPAPDKEMKKR